MTVLLANLRRLVLFHPVSGHRADHVYTDWLEHTGSFYAMGMTPQGR